MSKTTTRQRGLCLKRSAHRTHRPKFTNARQDSPRGDPPLVMAPIVLAAAASAPAAESPLLQGPSPYVEERARDLVAWRGWDRGALDEARRLDRPVFLLIGDPACPDCRAARAPGLRRSGRGPPGERRVHQRGGGPLRPAGPPRRSSPRSCDAPADARGRALAVFLLPDGRPFAAQAGIAPEDRGASPGLKTLALRRLSDFQHDRAGMEAEAGLNVAWLARAQSSAPPRGPLARDVVDRALKGLTESFDVESGGFGPAGEVPPGAPRLLLEEHGRRATPRPCAWLRRPWTASRRATASRPRACSGRRPCCCGRWRRPTPRAARSATARRPRPWPAGCSLEMRDAAGGFVAMGPGRSGDERVIAGWNGLMIGALATSGALLQRTADLEAAKEAAARVKDRLGSAVALRHSVRGTAAGGSALLEDYAYLADGLLDLYDASGEERWLTEAVALAEAATGRFADATGGGFFATDAAHEPFPVRLKQAFDGPMPSGNGVMARVLLRLGRATGQARYRDLARAPSTPSAATCSARRGGWRRWWAPPPSCWPARRVAPPPPPGRRGRWSVPCRSRPRSPRRACGRARPSRPACASRSPTAGASWPGIRASWTCSA